MSRSLSRIQSILLGLVVLVGLGLALFALFAVDGEQGRLAGALESVGVPRSWLGNGRFHVRVGFRQVQGVEVGTRVRVQGINAGEVVAIERPSKPGADVVLRLRLSNEVRDLVRADATAQIVSEGMIGGKVVEIDPGTEAAAPVADNAVIASRPGSGVSDVLAKLDNTLQEVRGGQGTLGKLVKDDQAYVELVELLRQGRGTLASIKQDADALKDMPFVRDYVKDAHKLLVRPDCEPYRQSFAERELFEPGRAVLTTQGKSELDKLVPWLKGLNHSGSEVVISASSDPKMEPQLALTLSQKQSEAVCTYLKDNHSVQKMGWFSRRKVTPIGLGISLPPGPEKDRLPAPRVEVLVFVPRG